MSAQFSSVTPSCTKLSCVGPAAVVVMPLPAAAAAAAATGCWGGRAAPLATAVSEPTVTCGDDSAATGLMNVEPCAAAATNAAC